MNIIPSQLDRITELETIINRGDDRHQNYWYLGLAYLLQGQELDARATWFIPIGNAINERESEELTNSLIDTLDRVCQQEYVNDRWDNVATISLCISEFAPDNFTNLCRYIVASIQEQEFELEFILESNFENLYVAFYNPDTDREILQQVILSLLEFPSTAVIDIITYILAHQSEQSDRQYFIQAILDSVFRIASYDRSQQFLVDLLEAIEPLTLNKLAIFKIISTFCSHLSQYNKSLAYALKFEHICSYQRVSLQLIGNCYLLKCMLISGYWQDAELKVKNYYDLLDRITLEAKQNIQLEDEFELLQSTMLLPYLGDLPRFNRQHHNRVAQLCFDYQERICPDVPPVELEKPNHVLRIGYIASTLYSHSVGWLSRWLWQHHDREKFQIFTYAINQNPEDPFYQQWFAQKSDASYCTDLNASQIAGQIKADEIDILIDLDSLTCDVTCQVLAFKPAPIQVTWLGWDASGIPTVDYFIADRYVVPDDADEYYQEKIWRMPGSYLCVDGFEVGIPSLTRADLNIPEDAVIYWTGQIGYKRHPETIRWQLEIIKQVPNSYLLIKGCSDRDIITNLFGTIATEVGVSMERLRFIDRTKDELTHRADLGMADIVLDTFPYNGATTTLETLWMGIPMVTKVGTQFSARNSYSSIKYAGLEEGIAWSDEEYINWGIKLGVDPDLRAQVRAKLKLSRHTSDLWNSQKFTQQMEDAYQQMWAIYQSS
jgi:predicted O-linked N-acetylglucosamine transferase (SPINDLY family)